VLESGVELVAGDSEREVWEGGVDIDGSGGKLVTDRSSLKGGCGTLTLSAYASTTWTILVEAGVGAADVLLVKTTTSTTKLRIRKERGCMRG
jgi:hypothetical protein